MNLPTRAYRYLLRAGRPWMFWFIIAPVFLAFTHSASYYISRELQLIACWEVRLIERRESNSEHNTEMLECEGRVSKAQYTSDLEALKRLMDRIPENGYKEMIE